MGKAVGNGKIMGIEWEKPWEIWKYWLYIFIKNYEKLPNNVII